MATLDDLEKILIKIEKNTAGKGNKSSGAGDATEKKVKNLETIFTSFISKFEKQVGILGNTIKSLGQYFTAKTVSSNIQKTVAALKGGTYTQSFSAGRAARAAALQQGGGRGLSNAAKNAAANAAGDAAAAGGEEGGSVLGGLAEAAASNPYTAAGIAVAALVAGLVVAGPILKSWSKSLLDSQENLKQFSGAMASVYNRKEIFETLQNMRVGEATAGSAGNLEDAYENLSIALEPATILLTNIWNNGVAILVNLMAAIIETVQSYMQWMVDLLTELIKILSFGNKTISDWLEKTYNANKKSPKTSPFEAFARSIDPQVRLGLR